MSEAKTFSVLFTGPMACFTRPEYRAERRSYDVMTPTAAIGAMSAIFWKPEIAWRISQIRVLNPIQFTSFTTNEVDAVIPKKVKSTIDPTKNRTQRMNSVLRDVAYVVDATYDIVKESHGNYNAYNDQIDRRLQRGACWQQPYFGLREMTANFEYARNVVDHEVEDRELGFMLYDFDWSGENAPTPIFKPASLVNGILVFGDL